MTIPTDWQSRALAAEAELAELRNNPTEHPKLNQTLRQTLRVYQQNLTAERALCDRLAEALKKACPCNDEPIFSALQVLADYSKSREGKT